MGRPSGGPILFWGELLARLVPCRFNWWDRKKAARPDVAATSTDIFFPKAAARRGDGARVFIAGVALHCERWAGERAPYHSETRFGAGFKRVANGQHGDAEQHAGQDGSTSPPLKPTRCSVPPASTRCAGAGP